MGTFESIDADGRVIQAGDVADTRNRMGMGEDVHRELRPGLPEDYLGYLDVLIGEGAGVSQVVDGGLVRAIAVWRVFTTTYCGVRFEIDDLVTAAADRSRGYGRTLLSHLERRAAAAGCPTLTLNSATHRGDAHKFYFREGYKAIGFHFSKDLAHH